MVQGIFGVLYQEHDIVPKTIIGIGRGNGDIVDGIAAHVRRLAGVIDNNERTGPEIDVTGSRGAAACGGSKHLV